MIDQRTALKTDIKVSSRTISWSNDANGRPTFVTENKCLTSNFFPMRQNFSFYSGAGKFCLAHGLG